ncbi:hypothetical protein BDB00DRAFT_522873 [Zychaea mexicana]|uniref:uncharacterized protein n=1 Tax=Zychaea mexicana TaxID=64656 RepID=UPI0022FF1356|nr:uncharacterized protein BDB00DRAFT_522873 [Zychaea mexicana]KAI9491005.1 hypothetical protein BDB00DRAFT_522873 [Zychaea mexicana]
MLSCLTTISQRHAWPPNQVQRVTYRFLSSKTKGPSREKLRAIPFTQHVEAANSIFKDYHGSGFFSARVTDAGAPQEIFLPFWVISCRVHAQIVQAQVGHNVMRNVYNPATKRNEVRYDTQWTWVSDQYRWTRDYLPIEHPGLHIYASHKYRRGLVNSIRSGQSLQEATAFTPQLFDRPAYPDMSSDYHVNRTVDPFNLYPATAVRFAKSYIMSTEEDYADAYLRKVYAADQTRLVKVEVKLENVKCAPVYYPAYVYTVHYLGRNLRTFINGNDLRVGGIRTYDWTRVAVVSAAGMATVMTMTGGVGWGGISGSFWIGVVLPTVMTSMLAMYFPLISLRFRDWKRQQEIHSAEQDPHTWDTDWVGAYDAFEDQQRYKTWKSENQYYQRQSRFWGGGASSSSSSRSTEADSDPQGYYHTLGVSPTATTADIQSAFRGLAMRHHPDRYSDPEEKKKATAQFQKISAAYSVLRDSRKRKTYDSTGRV